MKRLHPLVGLARALQYASYGVGIPIFLVSIGGPVFGGNGLDIALLAPLVGLGVLAGASYGYFSYLRYTYEITEETFDVSRGVFARQVREIPHGRIQNVDVTRSFVQNLLGVAVVRIETAGGGSTEARLDFVSATEAERLQQDLRARREAARRDTGEPAPAEKETDSGADTGRVTTTDDSDGETPAEPSPAPPRPESQVEPEPLFALSPTELAVHAATTFRPRLIVVLAIGTPLVDDLVAEVLLRAAAPFGGPDRLVLSGLTPDEALALAVAGVPLGLASAWVLGVVLSINQYFGFTLGRRGEELVYERGLLSTYSGTIPTGKVQTLTVTENVLQRALGYAGLSIDTAGYAGGNEGGGDRSAIPLAERRRVESLVEALEGADLDAAFARPPKRARERYAVRYGLALAVVLGATFAVSRFVVAFSLWWTPALLAPLLPVLAHLKWKHRGYALGEDHLLVRSGFLSRRTQVVPYRRLQTVVRSRTVFQRRRRLASLVADTASGAVLNRGGAVAHDQSDAETADLQAELRERLQASLSG
ncbi:MAG: PH domain-containing protein [Halobacteriales archaeon]